MCVCVKRNNGMEWGIGIGSLGIGIVGIDMDMGHVTTYGGGGLKYHGCSSNNNNTYALPLQYCYLPNMCS